MKEKSQMQSIAFNYYTKQNTKAFKNEEKKIKDLELQISENAIRGECTASARSLVSWHALRRFLRKGLVHLAVV